MPTNKISGYLIMDKKKMAYIAGGATLAILGYLNYFADEGKINKNGDYVETKRAVYDGDGYHIEALRQRDYLVDKKGKDGKVDKVIDRSWFEKAKAVLKGVVLTGDTAVLNSQKDLLLDRNIYGKTSNGWEIETQQLQYLKGKDQLNSTVGITAINREKGVTISGKNLSSDGKFKHVNLKGDIKLATKTATLAADEAIYNDDTKKIEIGGKSHLVGEKIGKNGAKLDGEFLGIVYDTNNSLLTTDKPFTMKYNDVQLSGEHLSLNDKTEAFEVTNNVFVTVSGYKIGMTSITSDGKDEIHFNGRISGTNGVNSGGADHGIYNKVAKTLTLQGNVEVADDKGGKLQTEYAIYSTDKKELNMLSQNGKDIVYTSPKEKITTKSLKYLQDKEELYLDNGYTYESAENRSSGEKLFYNKKTSDGIVTKGFVENIKDGKKGSGDEIKFNKNKKDMVVTGHAVFEDKDYIFNSDKVEYYESKGYGYVPGPFVVTRKSNNGKFHGLKAEYDIKNKILKVPGAISYADNEYTLNGNDLTFNQNTGIGQIMSNVVVRGLKDNSILTTSKAEYKQGEYLKLPASFVYKRGTSTVNGGSGIYKEKEKKGYIPGLVTFSDSAKQASGQMYDAVYDTVGKVLTGNNFTGTDPERAMKGGRATYYLDDERVILQNNAMVRDKTTTVYSEYMEYSKKTGLAKLPGKFRALYTDYTIVGDRGTVNTKSNVVDADNVTVTSSKGEKLRGDKVKGSMYNMNLDLIGNVSGFVYQDNVPVNFKGEFARGYFTKKDGKTQLQRIEVRRNAVITKQGSTLYADFLEARMDDKTVFGKDKTKVVSINEKGEKTVITADMFKGNMNTKIIDVLGRVKIVHNDKKGKVTTITAKKGRVRSKDNIVELRGNVLLDDGESIVRADEADYNMNTKKIKARGNVNVDYKSKVQGDKNIGTSAEAVKILKKK